jgi:hypothetical protein
MSLDDVVELWSRIHLCGHALLIGDREVTFITPGVVRCAPAREPYQTFYGEPE